jgi:cytochrome c peroxidase
VGGNFWDMRATGRRLGNPAAEQAEGPPTNPLEMGLPDIACVVYRASRRPYRPLFKALWGRQAFVIAWPADVQQVCNQPSPPPANDPTRGAMLPTRPENRMSTRGVAGFLREYQLLSHPSTVDTSWVPPAPGNLGRFQVPTLRNVDKRPYPTFVKAYGHNGYFKSLKSIVRFYNTRDVLPRCGASDPGEGTTCWPAPESTENMNTKFVGRLGLSDEEENAPVAFMERRRTASRKASFPCCRPSAPNKPVILNHCGSCRIRS